MNTTENTTSRAFPSPHFSPVSGCKAQTTTTFVAFSIRSLDVPQVLLRSPPTPPASRVHGFTVVALRAMRDVPILRDQRISLRFAPFASKTGEKCGLAEGRGRFSRDRQYHFRIALGSAREVDVHLRLLLAIGTVDSEKAEMAIELFDRVRAMTWRLLNPKR